jgi:drug/metabolite transporter (DMT)-like permease
MVLAVVGAVLAAIAPDPEHGRRGVGRGLLFAILAAVFIGVAMVCLAEAAQGGVVWSALLFRVSSTPLVLGAALITGASFRAASRRDVGFLIGVGAADNGANVLFALATTRGLLTLVSVIASLVPVVTAFWARFLLHEHLTRHQLVGVALALVGILLIAAG